MIALLGQSSISFYLNCFSLSGQVCVLLETHKTSVSAVHRPAWVLGTVVIEWAQSVSWPDGVKGILNQG